MKWLIVIVAAIIGLAYYTRPPFEDHQQKIYVKAAGTDAGFGEKEASLPVWEDVDFIDWNILTIVQDKEKMSMVSLGIGKGIVVVDTDWGLKAFGKKKTPEAATR